MIMSSSEVLYREGYTEGYQQAIKDITAYKVPKIKAKMFSINELKKWENFEGEYYEDFCNPPTAPNTISTQKIKENNLKYVYVIRGSRINSNESNYKIGIATNIKRRLSNMQTSSPEELKLIFKHRTDQPDKLEKSLHNYFKYYRIRNNGEWFRFEDKKIIDWLRKDFQEFVSQL